VWPSGEGSGVRVAGLGIDPLVLLMFLAGTLSKNSGWLLSPKLGMKAHQLVSESRVWGSSTMGSLSSGSLC